MLVKEINSRELAIRLASEKPPVLLDVRTPQEMLQASIPQGKPLPLSVLPLRIEEVPSEQEVVFYCRTGARSAQACLYLTQRGYDKVYNLHGGIVSWVSHGLPVAPMDLSSFN